MPQDSITVDTRTDTGLSRQIPADSEKRIANIARIRILAAFGVVWFHMDCVPARVYGATGLPIFLLVSCSLIAASCNSYDIKKFISKRAGRLMIPWVFWSAVYLACKYAGSLRHGESFFNELNINMLAIGGCIHLWYLPYALVIATAVYQVTFWTRKVPTVLIALLSAIIGAVLIFCSSVIMTKFNLSSPFMQWTFASGAVPLGFAYGQTFHIKSVPGRHILLIVITLAALCSCAGLFLSGFTHLVIPYSLAVILVCLAHIWHGRFDKISQFMDSMTYGIFLVHILIYRSINAYFDFSSIPWVEVMITFASSTIIVYILKKTRLKIFV